eukprot:scaffold19_cov114-Cylindrotheca_fusiformis.AAC.17
MEKPQDECEQENGKAKNEENRQANTSLHRISALRNHRMRFQDAIDPNAMVVTAVGRDDVLLGRGKGFQDYEGNKRMRAIVDKYKEKYHSVKRSEKRGIVEEVYREIIEGGARFLTKSTGSSVVSHSFVVVDEEVAIQKVNNTLRCKKGFHKAVASETQGTGSGVSTERVVGDAMTSGSMGRQLVSRIDCGGVFPLNLSPMQPSMNPPAASIADSLQQNNFGRYGSWGGLSSIPPFAAIYPQEDLGYCSMMMRRNQLLQETLLLRQLHCSLVMNTSRGQTNAPISNGSSEARLREQRWASLPRNQEYTRPEKGKG